MSACGALGLRLLEVPGLGLSGTDSPASPHRARSLSCLTLASSYITGHSIGPSEYLHAPPPSRAQHIGGARYLLNEWMPLIGNSHDVLSTFSPVPTQAPPTREFSVQFTFFLKGHSSSHSFIQQTFTKFQPVPRPGWGLPISCGSQSCPASVPVPKKGMSLCKEGGLASQTPLGAPQFTSKPSTCSL